MAISPYNIARFQPLTQDGLHFNVFDASYNGMRFAVKLSKQIVVDASSANNLPGLAYSELGSEFLWWAILMYNGLSDPLNDIVPGTVLNIPERASLIAYLNRPVGQSGVQAPALEGSTIL